jgi:hypothetical protein
MKNMTILLVALISTTSFSQSLPSSQGTLEAKKWTLQERYAAMKKSTETFQDYKVIKEVVLDGVWRIGMDSIKSQKASFANAKEIIAQLESEVAAQKTSVKRLQDSMEGTVYDSKHISFFGISFSKSLFITLVMLIIVGQIVAIGAVTGKLKLMYHSMKEKVESLDMLDHQFEDYKKRALEKQAKLSRELQTERNKLMNFEPHASAKSIL